MGKLQEYDAEECGAKEHTTDDWPTDQGQREAGHRAGDHGATGPLPMTPFAKPYESHARQGSGFTIFPPVGFGSCESSKDNA